MLGLVLVLLTQVPGSSWEQGCGTNQSCQLSSLTVTGSTTLGAVTTSTATTGALVCTTLTASGNASLGADAGVAGNFQVSGTTSLQATAATTLTATTATLGTVDAGTWIVAGGPGWTSFGHGSSDYDPPSIGLFGSLEYYLPATGAQVGDWCSITPGNIGAPQLVFGGCYVDDAGYVKGNIYNAAAFTINGDAGVWAYAWGH